jgi:glycosyltransferase involved in cell wall biosynthesis
MPVVGPRFALVSHVLPPAWSGQAMALHQLLRDLPPARYCLIATGDSRPPAAAERYAAPLAGPRHVLPDEAELRGLPTPTIDDLHRQIERRAERIAAILRAEDYQAVVACTGGDLLDLPAAYLAGRLTDCRFYAYLFDDYSQQLHPHGPHWQRALERLEPVLLRDADGVIAPNEAMQADLARRYDVTATVVHNPCDLAAYAALPAQPAARPEGEIRIVFTGAVYAAHFDAFHNLLAAIEALARPEIRLHIYTALPPAWLRDHGVSGPVVIHPHQPSASMPAIQRQADILFLPLAFEAPYPRLIRLASPAKLGEYLAAGRPALVHAPAGSFVADYVREHACGLVVDRPDPAALAAALEQLLTEPDLSRRLSVRTERRAAIDFDRVAAQQRFLACLATSAPAATTDRPSARLARLELAAAALTGIGHELSDRLLAARNRLVQRDEELHALRAQPEAALLLARQERDALQAQASSLQRQVDDLTTRERQTAAEVAQLRQTLAAQAARLADLDNLAADQAGYARGLEAALARHEEQAIHLRAAMSDLSGESERLRTVMTEQAAYARGLERDLATILSDRDALRRRLERILASRPFRAYRRLQALPGARRVARLAFGLARGRQE